MYVCFNDECSYFVNGWKHMDESMQHNCSYRHRYDPDSGATGPLPVCSDEVGRSDIIEE